MPDCYTSQPGKDLIASYPKIHMHRANLHRDPIQSSHSGIDAVDRSTKAVKSQWNSCQVLSPSQAHLGSCRIRGFDIQGHTRIVIIANVVLFLGVANWCNRPADPRIRKETSFL